MSASYIVGAVRTPRGRGKREMGALSGIHPQELFAQTLITLRAGWF
jgi:acetyl-CoA C-acetyltransferase